MKLISGSARAQNTDPIARANERPPPALHLVESASASAAVTPLPQRFTRTAMVFHWVIAGLLMVNIGLGLTGDMWPDGWARPVLDLHKSIGITVMVLAVLRVLWRLFHRPPPLPATLKRGERRFAYAVHGALYVLIFTIPLTGWLHDSTWNAALWYPLKLYHLVPWPRFPYFVNLPPDSKRIVRTALGCAHTWLGYGLYAVLAIHVGGVCKHELMRKPMLRRMLPWGK